MLNNDLFLFEDFLGVAVEEVFGLISPDFGFAGFFEEDFEEDGPFADVVFCACSAVVGVGGEQEFFVERNSADFGMAENIKQPSFSCFIICKVSFLWIYYLK